MTKIYYKTKTALTDTLEKEFQLEVLKEKSTFGKLFSSKEFADIYIHSGALDDDSIERVLNAKAVIVNSYRSKQELIRKIDLDNAKIHVVYPCIDEEYLKPKESKEALALEFGFDKKNKIILFTAKNFKSNGAKEFCDIVASLNYKHIQVIVAGDAKQINNLKFQTSKYNFGEKLLFLEDYPNQNLLFSAADIFLLPTQMTGFASNVLKAMFFKCAVFVTSNTSSSEVVDIFATMNSPTDRSITFKVDALLGNKIEMKRNKKLNKDASENFLLSKQIKKLKDIVSNV